MSLFIYVILNILLVIIILIMEYFQSMFELRVSVSCFTF